MSILRDLHVIEISASGAAAMAAKHFADWGARVTILEPAAGTPLRDEPPYYEVDGEQRSATWAWLARGKTAVRGVPLEDARRACESADVVLAEADAVEAVLGLRPLDVRAAFGGKTTFVLSSSLGLDGPYADYKVGDLGVCALGGWTAVLGDPRREPLRPVGGLVARVTGIYAFVAALVALRHLRQGGAPQFVDLTEQCVAPSMVSSPWLIKSMAGLPYERTGSLWPLGVMECKDGYVGIPPLTATHWELLCHLMGLDDVLELPEGRDPMYRIQHSAELYERVKPWLHARTRAEIVAEAQAWRLPAAPCETIADRLACPQLAARGFWHEAEIEERRLRVPRVSYFINGIEPVARGPLRDAGAVAASPPGERQGSGPPPALPFEGLRVLDLTSFWSGPYATMLLGTLGADVIKVESVQRPDPYRFTLVVRSKERWFEWSAVWNDANCDKRDITLDLSSAEGRALFERLVPMADVVISNFANRVMPNLGLTNEHLRSLNPRLISVTMPGYGPGGPWESYVGYAIPFEQMVVGSLNGYADGVPYYAGGFCDPVVGMHTVAAIELALRRREETGLGTDVEIPQCEILDSLLAPEQIAMQLGAPLPSRRGNKHEWMAPHEAYRVAGRDVWLTIAVASDDEFAALSSVLGLPLASDARFATIAARKQNEAELDVAISAALAGRDGLDLERDLQAAGVRACRVIKTYDLPDDPNMRHLGFFQMLTRAETGAHAYKTWPFRFSDIDTSHKLAPAHLGEHNAEVLQGMLGVSDEEMARLKTAHIIGTEPLGVRPVAH